MMVVVDELIVGDNSITPLHETRVVSVELEASIIQDDEDVVVVVEELTHVSLSIVL